MYDTAVRLFEFIQLDGRILQFLQQERTLRELWMDGRALPSGESLENIGPAWYGHSVAEWREKNWSSTRWVWMIAPGSIRWVMSRASTRAWEERYRRISADTLELRMILHDPAYYSVPWEAETRIFRRQPPEGVTYFGWYGIFSALQT